jgi:hypothetical protein
VGRTLGVHHRGGGDQGGIRMTIRVFDSNPTYDDWCEANGLDPDNDETYNAYCEWRSNNR